MELYQVLQNFIVEIPSLTEDTSRAAEMTILNLIGSIQKNLYQNINYIICLPCCFMPFSECIAEIC